MKIIVCNHPAEVARFVADRIGVKNILTFGAYQAIGLEEDGRLIAGMVVTDYNGRNAWIHLAGDGRRWMTRYYLWACCDYLFNQLGCSRISGWVEASNEAAIALNKHLGMTIEAPLEGAARDGGDVFIMRLKKDQCRFLKLGERYGVHH